MEGTWDNPGTADPQAWAGDMLLAEPHHTDHFMGHCYSNGSLGQLLEAVPSQGIGSILVNPLPAEVTNDPTGAAMTQMKRKAVDCENNELPRKRGWPGTNPNVAIHFNPGAGGHQAPTISHSCRERKVSQKVATYLAEEAATKAARR